MVPVEDWDTKSLAPVGGASNMTIILMGVSGGGKTTVGKRLAGRQAWPFVGGDNYLPAGNCPKISRGTALTVVDRKAWLLSLADCIRGFLVRSQLGLLACSTPKQGYLEKLNVDPENIEFVYS